MGPGMSSNVSPPRLCLTRFWQVIGPIAGGWIVETRLGWRFNFWLMMMVSACALTIGFLATPETVSTSQLIW